MENIFSYFKRIEWNPTQKKLIDDGWLSMWLPSARETGLTQKEWLDVYWYLMEKELKRELTWEEKKSRVHSKSDPNDLKYDRW